MLLELRMQQQHRLGARAQLTRIENQLLGLEIPSRLQEYDQGLACAIREKEHLLAGLIQVVAAVKRQTSEADVATTERARELEALRLVMELQANKPQQLED